MKQLTIVAIVGARPQFVKAATVWRVVRNMRDVRHTLIHTGQHYDAELSAVFFEELDLPEPDVNLGIGSATHGAQTGRMLESLESSLVSSRPDCVLVYGDTNSTLAGALAAAKLQIPVAHVEAGLRSFNRRMPEEVNRVLVDHVSSLLYAPTAGAADNLAAEGIAGGEVSIVGDVMLDAAKHYTGRTHKEVSVRDRLEIEGPYVLATIHRVENTEDPQRLEAILTGLDVVGNDCTVVAPLHPRTRRAIAALGKEAAEPHRVKFLEPVGYLDMLDLEKHAHLIATDSGGVQKEAYFFGVPCVTLRDETEWTELVENGWNVVCPPTQPSVIAEVIVSRFGTIGTAERLYGDGNAAQRIVENLVSRIRIV